jgi:hypothetical protein
MLSPIRSHLQATANKGIDTFITKLMLMWLDIHIDNPELATASFALLYRQYGLIGELRTALGRTFVRQDTFEVDLVS